MADGDSTPSTSFGLPDILGLLGGLFKTYSAAQESSTYNDAVRAAMNRENQLYQKYASTTPADQMQGIMALKAPLTSAVRNAIIQDITAQMAGRGLTGSTGIVQQAIAEALVKAELPLWQMAIQAYQEGRQLPIQAMPRTLPARPGASGNPFGSLVDIATNRKILDAIFKQPTNLPELPGTTGSFGDIYSSLPSLPQSSATGILDTMPPTTEGP